MLAVNDFGRQPRLACQALGRAGGLHRLEIVHRGTDETGAVIMLTDASPCAADNANKADVAVNLARN
jgi:hypothetical protein